MNDVRRRVNTKLVVKWSTQNCEYSARIPIWPNIVGKGKTPEQALLAMSMELTDFSEDLILEGNQI